MGAYLGSPACRINKSVRNQFGLWQRARASRHLYSKRFVLSRELATDER